MVEIPKGIWTRPLEIEQSYEEVHKRKTEALVMTIEEEEVPWYYDFVKFLELGAYSVGADKRERRSIRMMARWSGPFIFKKIMSGGVTRITDLDWKELLCLINMDRLWKYHI